MLGQYSSNVHSPTKIFAEGIFERQMVSHVAQRRHYNSIVDGVDLEWYLLRLNEDISMARSKGILT